MGCCRIFGGCFLANSYILFSNVVLISLAFCSTICCLLFELSIIINFISKITKKYKNIIKNETFTHYIINSNFPHIVVIIFMIVMINIKTNSIIIGFMVLFYSKFDGLLILLYRCLD